MLGFDALQVPTLAQFTQLRRLGFEVYSGYTRELTQQQVGAAKSVGFAVLPIIERGYPTSTAYFTQAQAIEQGLLFLDWAQRVGMPEGFPFIETMDFDCSPADMEGTILPYVNKLIEIVGGRNPLWLYGPYDVIETAKGWAGIAGFMQAYAPAWSNGRNSWVHPLADSVQVRNGLWVGGVQMDIQRFTGSGVNLWR